MTVFLYLFAILALVGAIGTVTSRHPISAAMSLVASFLSVASLYALLDAHLIAAVQVIVYVGAIMVLIIYTILLMDLRDEDVRERLGWLGAHSGAGDHAARRLRDRARCGHGIVHQARLHVRGRQPAAACRHRRGADAGHASG
jgi:uncharacterized MnhB-related membrane protein